MKNCIITISREYGSGGRDVGRMLAEQLGLPVFDKEIMHLAIEKSGLPGDFIEKHCEKVPSKFIQALKRLSLNVPSTRMPSGYTSHVAAIPLNKKTDADNVFQTQSAVIKEIAESGSCVIIGRLAGYVLREHPNLFSVFIRGDFEDRVKRTIEVYNLPAENAAKDVKKIDKHRANHYKLFTDQKWGDAKNYDLVINTSSVGIAGAVNVIKSMLSERIKE
ncbi:MAG: cytidylate kinase-like family protein [Defluviitaleaceae bacterium]|nr:cytidylate kinase-like family protein [Defluviitaleaceae bacterium]